MPGISLERHGFVKCGELIDAIAADMLANGFVQKFPASAYSALTDDKIVLEAGPTIDPLNTGANPQPWRIYLEAVSDFKARMCVGTPLQLGDDGIVAKLGSTAAAQQTGKPVEWSGVLGTEAYISQANENFAANHFVDRAYRLDAASLASYPMSYRLTISDHGFMLFVWEDASEYEGDKFSWVCVQRAVNNATGEVQATGKCPVYCVYSLNNNVRKFIVRESDVLRPTLSVSATLNTNDSRAIINPAQQVAIDEDSKYIVTFPNGLNTPRHAYTQELDLLAYTGAEVISMWTEVPLTVYGEQTPRVYKAMQANQPNDQGMRILMLVSGSGVTPQ